MQTKTKTQERLNTLLRDFAEALRNTVRWGIPAT